MVLCKGYKIISTVKMIHSKEDTMARLAIVIGGVLFIAAGIIVLIPGFNWQVALVLFAIGFALLLFFFKG